MITAVGAALLGFGLLVVASNWFVSGSAALALRLQVPAVVVGAVVIGFGTSAPELLASALAAADGARDIAVGNIVGSNAANLSLVLGVVAIAAAPCVTSGVLRRELPLMGLGMAFLALSLARFDRVIGAVLVLAFVVAMVLIIRSGRLGDDPLSDEVEHHLSSAGERSGWWLTGLTSIGLLGTVAGAQLLVTGAQSIAERLNLAGGLVGFTVVALGTSLPEVVTALQAARQGEPDLAIGNVVGSNLFNSLGIGGVIVLISPGPVASGLIVAAWIGAALGVAVWVLMWTSRQLVRWEGALLIATYFATLLVVA